MRGTQWLYQILQENSVLGTLSINFTQKYPFFKVFYSFWSFKKIYAYDFAHFELYTVKRCEEHDGYIRFPRKIRFWVLCQLILPQKYPFIKVFSLFWSFK